MQSDKGLKIGATTANLFQLAQDSPRQLIEHLRSLRRTKKISLFLYSRGGDVAVPWVLSNLLRRYCEELEVIIPYRAHSAATMIALAADRIVMGKHAELGPIDPTMNIQEVSPEDQAKTKTTTIAVEDITSFINLAKEGMGLSNQRELGEAFKQLTEKVGPVALGSINRQQSYIRNVAKKLVRLRKKTLDEAKMKSVVDGLITGAYYHQHAITREEAISDFGFDNIEIPGDDLEEEIWQLYLGYESQLGIGDFVQAEDLLKDLDETILPNQLGIIIESRALHSHYVGDLVIARNRRPLPTVNLNLNLSLPPNAQLDQNFVKQLQTIIQQIVHDELRRQSPVVGYSIGWQKDRWETLTQSR